MRRTRPAHIGARLGRGDTTGTLWATLAIFVALLLVLLVDRSPERHPRRRLPVVLAAGVVVLAIIGLLIFAAIQPVVSHIEM